MSAEDDIGDALNVVAKILAAGVGAVVIIVSVYLIWFRQ